MSDNETAFVGDDQEEKAMTSTLAPLETVAAPTPSEQCDRCGAGAKLRIITAGGGDLVFCGHHANKYAQDLVKIAVEVAAEPGFIWRGSELETSR